MFKEIYDSIGKISLNRVATHIITCGCNCLLSMLLKPQRTFGHSSKSYFDTFCTFCFIPKQIDGKFMLKATFLRPFLYLGKSEWLKILLRNFEKRKTISIIMKHSSSWYGIVEKEISSSSIFLMVIVSLFSCLNMKRLWQQNNFSSFSLILMMK